MPKTSGKLAKRYARALLGVAKAQGDDLSALTEKLSTLSDLTRANEELATALQNPLFSKKGKWGAIEKISDLVGLSPAGKNFLRVVVDKDRVGSLVEIAEAFSEEVDQDSGVFRVEVTAAEKLPDQEVEQIEKGFRAKVDGKPAFDWKFDPEILGGLIFRYQGRLVDGSVRGRLNRLERQLS